MSPAIQGDYISDLDPIQAVTQLAGGLFEVDVPAGPVAGGYVSRRMTTEQLVGYLITQGLGGPLSPLQTVRFRTRTEANAPGAFGGQVLEELDYSTLFTYARVLVEFWRDNPTDPNEHPRGQELIAVYDPNATPDHFGYATSGGPAAGVSRLGLKLVFPDDPAATGVLQYDAAQAVKQGQLRYYDDGQGVAFYEALQDMSAPVPAPVRGTVTAYWKLVDKPPVPGGGQGSSPTTYTIAAALAARDAGTLTVGSVIINGTWDNQGDSTVFAFALEPGLLSATGWLRTTPGSLVLRKFDVSTGATAKLNENEVDFASLLGRPIQRADAIAAMDAKSLVIGSDIVLGTWNGQRGGVLLPVLGPSAYFPIGVIESGGTLVPVVADVRAGTYYLAKLDGGGGSGFLQGVYTVQPGDITSPAGDVVIAVPGALSFGQVGVAVPGVSGQDVLVPGTDYTAAPGQLTILASLSPSLQAGYEIHYSYLLGSVTAPPVVQPPRHVLVTTPNSRFNDLNLSGEVTFTGGLLNNVSSVKAQLLKGGATAISQPRAGSLSDVLSLLNSDVASLSLAERLYYTIRFQTTPALQANVAQLTLDTTLSGVEFEAVPPHTTPFLAYSNGGTGPPPGFGGPVPGESFEEDDSRWIMETGSAPTIGRDSTWSMGQVYLFNSVDANNPTTVRGIEFFANGVLNVNAGDTVATNYLLRLYQQDRVTLLGEYNVVTTKNQFGGRNGVALTIAGLPPQVYYMRVVSTSAGFMCLDNYQLV